MGWNKGTENPNYKHGLRKTRLYRIWANMKSRCYNPNTSHYDRYGGRGIKVYEDWIHDFKTFYDWSMQNGYADNLSIDRINNDGNYEPDNCRWVSSKEQSNNVCSNKNITIDGVTKTLMEWCDHYKINYKTVRDRIKRNWSIEKALSTNVETKFRGDHNAIL